jgi:hypothetical protein
MDRSTLSQRPVGRRRTASLVLLLIFLGVIELMPEDGEYLRWAKDRDLDTALELYNGLEDFVRTERPFQGVIGFSEGAGVGASLLAYQEA